MIDYNTFTQELFFQVFFFFFFSLQFCEVGGPVIIHKRTSRQIWLQVKEASKIIVWDIVRGDAFPLVHGCAFVFYFVFFYFGRSHINWPITQVFWNIGQLPPPKRTTLLTRKILSPPRKLNAVSTKVLLQLISPVCPKPHSYFLNKIA